MSEFQIEVDYDELIDQLMANGLEERINDAVSNAFSYRDDNFRVSWMRMMESELQELCDSNRDSACGHGQKIYDGIFHAIRQFLIYENTYAKEYLGLDNLPQTVAEVASAAVDAKIKDVWVGSYGGATIVSTPEGEVPSFTLPLVREDDPELERLLAEEEAIEARTRVSSTRVSSNTAYVENCNCESCTEARANAEAQGVS